MHDYDLPPEWPGMAAEERDRWFHQERARRQALRQRTAFAARHREEKRRRRRRTAARETVTLGGGVDG